MKMVKESWLSGHVHAPLESTFIQLIPKSNNHESFNDFRAISLCNCMCKIISKIISRRLK